MVKVVKKVTISEMPEQVDLQFDVKTEGEKDVKYSQKQIFEMNKGDRQKERDNKIKKNYEWRKANGKK